MKSRPATAGFTLLELLVAVTVLGLLVIGLTQGVRVGVNLWDAQIRRSGKVAELDATARVLRNLLTFIPISATAASAAAPVAIGFKGEPNLISFTGDLPTGLGGKQRADIIIRLKGGTVTIAWAPHFHQTPDTTVAQAPLSETELIRDVGDLQFSYWGAANPTAPAAWLTQWDGPSLPELIRVRLGFAKHDPRHWPDLIVTPSLSSPIR